MGSKRHKNTSGWFNNTKNQVQGLTSHLREILYIQDWHYILRLRPCIQLGLVQINCRVTTKNNSRKHSQPGKWKSWQILRYWEFSREAKNTYWQKYNTNSPNLNLKDDMKKELQKMEKMGVIEKVNEPTDWVTAIAYRRKRMES